MGCKKSNWKITSGWRPNTGVQNGVQNIARPMRRHYELDAV